MTHFRILLAILALSLTFSSTTLADNQELASEVMAIHDEAMEKMTDMYELKLKLQELQAQTGPSVALNKAIEDLQHAHSEMMQWMREYQPPKDGQEQAAVENYLLNEREVRNSRIKISILTFGLRPSSRVTQHQQ